MYTIQKYLETNSAAWVLFCFPLIQVLVLGEFSVGHCFLRQRSVGAFQSVPGATPRMPGRGSTALKNLHSLQMKLDSGGRSGLGEQ